MSEDKVQKLIGDILVILESTTIFTIPPHYERWEEGFKSLDPPRRQLSEVKVRLEQTGRAPVWLVSDLAGVQSRLNDFVKLRDDFYRQFPSGGDSHNWSSRDAAERNLEELQGQVSSLRNSIRSHSSGSKKDSRNTEKLLAYGFGVIFVVVLLAIAVYVPNPTPFQFVVFKVVLALAAAGVAAMIPGFIEFNIPTYLRAGGAIAVFAIVFFKNPASLVIQKVDPHFIDMGTASDQPLGVIVDRLRQKQNVTINFSGSCDPGIQNIPIEKGDHEGKDIQDSLDNLRQRAKGEEPVYRVIKEGDRRYEITCP